MTTRFLQAAAWVAAVFPSFVVAEPLALDQALALAAQRSDASRSARAGIVSADEAAQSAGQLPDPVLRVGIENLPVTGPDRFHTARDSQTMKRIGISQEWVSRDKRMARSAAAQAMAAREEAQLLTAVAETRLQTSLAFIDVYYAQEALKLTTLMQHHADEEFVVARARLASANASGQEVLALTAAQGMAEDESTDVRQQMVAAQVALQRWTGVPVDEVGEFEASRPLLPQEVFIARNPVVLARQKDLELARLEAEVARTARRPNWTWEVSYGQRTGSSDMMSAGVSIPLPVAPGQRQDRDAAAKVALVEKADAELARAIRSAQAEYLGLVTNWELLRSRVRRYAEAVVRPATQRVDVATAAYRSNQGSLLTLFEARRAEVEAQRKLLNLERELARTSAQFAYRPAAPEVAP